MYLYKEYQINNFDLRINKNISVRNINEYIVLYVYKENFKRIIRYYNWT